MQFHFLEVSESAMQNGNLEDKGISRNAKSIWYLTKLIAVITVT
jgi:hypothetical protein